MTLNLKMLATLDAGGVESGARDARRAISGLGETAENTAADMGRLSSAAEASVLAARAQGTAFRISGQEAAKSNRLAAAEVNMLAQQISDGAIQVASGQSLFTAILQQGSQVQFLLGSKGVNTIGGSIALLKQGLIGFLNPINLALAGLAGGAAAASALYRAIADDTSATEALEHQEDLIARLAERYGDVEVALDRLQDRPSAALIALDTDELESQAQDIRALIADVEKDIRRSLRLEAGALTALAEPLSDDAAVFRAYQAELRATAEAFSTADTEASDLIARLLELARTAPDTTSERAIRDLITEARNADDGLLQLVERLSEVEAALQGVGSAADHLGRIDEAANSRIADTFAIFEERDARNRLRSALRPNRSPSSGADRQAEQLKQLLTVQDQTLERLRLEISLIGRSDAARQRALAALEAEQSIRELGLDRMSAGAIALRENALAIAEETRALQDQEAAWAALQSAGERAIRSIVSELSGGDLTGALSAVINQVSELALQLAAINPLTNALFGTSYPTLSFASGVFGSVFGGGGVSAAVSAATVGLYRAGGPTGSGPDDEVAGLVHRNEYVFDARSTRRIGVGTLEALRQGALRGYQGGGFVETLAFPARVPQPPSRSGPGDFETPKSGGDTHIHITTPDIERFRASRTQIAGEVARLTARGQRNG